MVLGTADPAARTALIADLLDRLERQLEQTQAAVSSLRRLPHPAPAGIVVDLRLAPAITAAGIIEVVEIHDVLNWYSEAMLELDAALASLRMPPTGPRVALMPTRSSPRNEEKPPSNCHWPIRRGRDGLPRYSFRQLNSL